MKLESLREIKSHFFTPNTAFSVGIARPQRTFPKSIAMGIGADGKLAIRCYGSRNQSRIQEAFVEAILNYCHNEAEVVKMERPMAYGWLDELKKQLHIKDKLPQHGKCRPVLIGWSVGHPSITCGSIGFFANVKGDNRMMVGSNNHVLAASNGAKLGDKVLQMGRHDGGTIENNTFGSLHAFVKLQKEHNAVDAAIAALNDDVEYDTSVVGEFGRFNGMSDGDLDVGMEVRKFGRTTSNTKGKITAIEVDNLQVNYGPPGVLSFDGQIEMVGEGIGGGNNDSDTYLKGGDSGSMTMDSKNRALALNFAGGGERAYGNQMSEVVKALKITLVK